MPEADLHVELRKKTGHRTAKVLRQNGKIPGIFYYHNEDSVPIGVEEKELQRLVHREINILNVIFPGGKNRKSVFREIQRDPVTDAIVHVDIMGIKLTEEVRLSIPVLLKGIPFGVKDQGGILEHLLREVTVEGLPLEIPEHIEVDVSGLNIGDVITLENVTFDKVKVITDIHHAVANVVHPKVIKEVVVEEEVELEEEAEAEEKVEGEEPSTEDTSKKE